MKFRDDPVALKSYERLGKLTDDLVAWTSWHCPVKHCDQIIYNSAIYKIKEITKHLKSHGLKQT